MVTITIHGANDAGDIVLSPDHCDPTKTQLSVYGFSGNDTIVISPVGNTGTVQVTINDVVMGTFTGVTGRIVVYGLGGNDNLQVSGSVKPQTWLYGGEGNDRLNAGNGSAVMLGGTGDDLMTGGSGRDIMIGGTGADRIVGNAGDDILIAGYTAYDDNEDALCALMHAWNTADSGSIGNYDARVSAIRTGVGVAGDFALKTDGANQTVFADNDADTLTGSAGYDLFFANLVADDGGLLDKITDLSSKTPETAADSDMA